VRKAGRAGDVGPQFGQGASRRGVGQPADREGRDAVLPGDLDDSGRYVAAGDRQRRTRRRRREPGDRRRAALGRDYHAAHIQALMIDGIL
jgi:hypothetical protein